MAIAAFRDFLHHLRTPVPYFPVTTEVRGLFNLVMGTAELTVGECFKHSSIKRRNLLAPAHITRGIQGVQLGALQFVPGFLATIGTVYVAPYFYNSLPSVKEWLPTPRTDAHV